MIIVDHFTKIRSEQHVCPSEMKSANDIASNISDIGWTFNNCVNMAEDGGFLRPMNWNGRYESKI